MDPNFSSAEPELQFGGDVSLAATDELENAEQNQNKCDHLMKDPITDRPTPAQELGHKFCPKCGVKL